MTIGQLLECVMSKTRCLTGEQFKSTAFESANIEEVSQMLHEAGFQRSGKEMLYHPSTGRQMEALIFIGPTYYQRLKHMVQDKIHSRSRGPIHAHGRQPTEGRSKDGGFRFGEMERDVIIAHGASALLQEKLYTLSDRYTMPVCQTCGLVCIKTKNKVNCTVCNEKSDIQVVEIPYACKLLFQELMAMNIAPRINVK
jgi:DNA-directed RNA polymerase II subunit RPB2